MKYEIKYTRGGYGAHSIYHVGPVQTQNPNEFVTETCFPVE